MAEGPSGTEDEGRRLESACEWIATRFPGIATTCALGVSLAFGVMKGEELSGALAKSEGAGPPPTNCVGPDAPVAPAWPAKAGPGARDPSPGERGAWSPKAAPGAMGRPAVEASDGRTVPMGGHGTEKRGVAASEMDRAPTRCRTDHAGNGLWMMLLLGAM